MNILELLKKPEGKILEFKRDLPSPEGILRVLVAFANTAGGTLIIGVEDGDHKVRGVERYNGPYKLDSKKWVNKL